MKKLANLDLIRDGFDVKRWHAEGYVIERETNGHHTANVIALVFYLFDDNPPIEIVRAALHHDVAERITGDAPFTAKQGNREFAEALARYEDMIENDNGLQTHLEPHLAPYLRFADMADLCFKCLNEITCGNMFFTDILARGMNVLHEMVHKEMADTPRAMEIFKKLFTNPNVFVEQIIMDYNNPTPEPKEVTH